MKKTKDTKSVELASVLLAVLAKHKVSTGSSQEIAEALDVKLSRLAQAEKDILAMREILTAKATETDALQVKLADRQTLALQMNQLAIMEQNRVQELKERDTKNAALLATLIVQRDILVSGGTRAEDLKSVLQSVNGTGAPKGFDKPAQTIQMDITGIRHIDENTSAQKDFDELCEWMNSPVPEHTKDRGGLSSILGEMMGIRDISSLNDISSLFREHGMDCSTCSRAAGCPLVRPL